MMGCLLLNQLLHGIGQEVGVESMPAALRHFGSRFGFGLTGFV